MSSEVKAAIVGGIFLLIATVVGALATVYVERFRTGESDPTAVTVPTVALPTEEVATQEAPSTEPLPTYDTSVFATPTWDFGPILATEPASNLASYTVTIDQVPNDYAAIYLSIDGVWVGTLYTYYGLSYMNLFSTIGNHDYFIQIDLLQWDFNSSQYVKVGERTGSGTIYIDNGGSYHIYPGNAFGPYLE